MRLHSNPEVIARVGILENDESIGARVDVSNSPVSSRRATPDSLGREVEQVSCRLDPCSRLPWLAPAAAAARPLIGYVKSEVIALQPHRDAQRQPGCSTTPTNERSTLPGGHQCWG